MQYFNNCTFDVDLPQYLSPSLITGDHLRPNMLISTPDIPYVLELSGGFETSLNNNASRKLEEYRYLLNDLKSKLHHVKFIALSISSFGNFGQSCNSFIQMCSDLSINTGQINYIITNLTSIIICATYYILCATNYRLNRTLYRTSRFSFHISFCMLQVCFCFI